MVIYYDIFISIICNGHYYSNIFNYGLVNESIIKNNTYLISLYITCSCLSILRLLLYTLIFNLSFLTIKLLNTYIPSIYTLLFNDLNVSLYYNKRPS
jgi:hypothetical protein